MNKRTLLLNSISGGALFGTNVVVSFVMTPIMIHTLGNRDYGIWELLVALVGYLGIFELGIGPALVRYVADAWSRKDQIALERIFNTGVFSLVGAGMSGLLVLLVLAAWPEQFLASAVSETGELAPVLVVFGLNLAAYLPRTALSAYLLGLQAHRFVNLIQIVVTIALSVAMYHVLTARWASPLLWLALIVFGGTILQGTLMLFWIVMVDRRVRIAVSGFSMGTMRELLGFGLKSTAISASTGVLNKLIGFSIAYTIGVAHVVYFVVPSRLVDYARSVGTVLGFPLTPYFTHLAGSGGPSAARTAWIQTTRILQVPMLGGAVALVALGEPFIRIWVGPEYAEQGRWILYILTVGLFAQGVVSNGSRVLMSLGKHGRVAVFSTVFAPTCFGASLVLGSVWGAPGVAAAVSLYVVGASVLEVTLTCRALGVGVSEYLRATALRFVVPIAVTGAIFAGMRQIGYPTTYRTLLVQGLVAGTAYLITVWFIALDATLRKSVRETFSRDRRKLAVDSPPRFDAQGG